MMEEGQGGRQRLILTGAGTEQVFRKQLRRGKLKDQDHQAAGRLEEGQQKEHNLPERKPNRKK